MEKETEDKIKKILSITFGIIMIGFFWYTIFGELNTQDLPPIESKSVAQTNESIKSDEVSQRATPTDKSIANNQNKKTTEIEDKDSDQKVANEEDNDVEESKTDYSHTTQEDSLNNQEDDNKENNNNDKSYEVVDIVDGDTVKLRIDGETETIRLIGIDTPETVHPTEPVECFGEEASNKAKELLSGKKVILEKDPSQGTRDYYGRLLGYIILPGDVNFNKLMIEQGYAYEYTYSTPYKYQEAFKTSEQNARTNEVGLWADGICDNWEEKSTQENETHEDQNINNTTSDSKWYVSSYYSSKYYYCEESDGWKSLSENYLEIYDSESALLAEFPNHTLHESCQ